MRGKYSLRPVMPPSFGLPPAIQKISAKDDSACAAASALVPLESLTNSTLPRRRPAPCGARGREAAQAVLQDVGTDAYRQRASRCASRILRVVQPRQGTDTADRAISAARAAGGAPDDFALDIDAVRQRIFHRDPHHAPSGLFDPVGGVLRLQPSSTPTIRGALRLHAATRRSSRPHSARACHGGRCGLR